MAKRKVCDVCGYGVTNLRRHQRTLRHQIRELDGGRGMWLADTVPFDGELAAAGVEVAERVVELLGSRLLIRMLPEWAAAFAVIVQTAFMNDESARSFIARRLPELRETLEFLWRLGERDAFYATVWEAVAAEKKSDTGASVP